MTLRNIALLSALAVVVGCQHHYQVRDPDTGKVYYTEVYRERMGGGVSFEDARTGRDVTLQESEITRIDGDLWDRRVDRDMDLDLDDDDRYTPAGSRIDVDVDDDVADDVDVDVDRNKVRIDVDD